LTRANLQKANLRYARLARAKLVESDLRHADLRDSDLHRIDDTNAKWAGADRQNAKSTDPRLAKAEDFEPRADVGPPPRGGPTKNPR
jgi:uncharacterized protein YjbI with pentapeptide repeats